jgi:hypothetical protein
MSMEYERVMRLAGGGRRRRDDGCGDERPYVPGRRYVGWDLADPAGRPLDEVRATRDDIARRVGALAAVLDGGDRASRGAA